MTLVERAARAVEQSEADCRVDAVALVMVEEQLEAALALLDGQTRIDAPRILGCIQTALAIVHGSKDRAA